MLIYDREETIRIDGQVKYQMHKYNYKTKAYRYSPICTFKMEDFRYSTVKFDRHVYSFGFNAN